MRKKYHDCEEENRNCWECSLSSHGKDCYNNKISAIARYRCEASLTQNELAENADINIRQIQKYESGEYDIINMTLGNASKLANALGINIEELLR